MHLRCVAKDATSSLSASQIKQLKECKEDSLDLQRCRLSEKQIVELFAHLNPRVTTLKLDNCEFLDDVAFAEFQAQMATANITCFDVCHNMAMAASAENLSAHSAVIQILQKNSQIKTLRMSGGASEENFFRSVLDSLCSLKHPLDELHVDSVECQFLIAAMLAFVKQNTSVKKVKINKLVIKADSLDEKSFQQYSAQLKNLVRNEKSIVEIGSVTVASEDTKSSALAKEIQSLIDLRNKGKTMPVEKFSDEDKSSPPIFFTC